jgi:hypothetical protein
MKQKNMEEELTEGLNGGLLRCFWNLENMILYGQSSAGL